MTLDDRGKELVAIGASVSAHCQPCLEYHVGKARESGASDEEMALAIEIGRQVGRGATSAMDRFATALLKAPVATSAGNGGGCCGP